MAPTNKPRDSSTRSPGKLASTLWFFGSSLLHTGVVVHSLNREYAFGGHDRPGASGVYWTRPGMEPPGGTFRCELLQGFTFQAEHEIETIIKDVSQEFLGPSYNLLSNNCNHFTSHLCQKLTGKVGPAWLNRAASIGVALPCVVPREWIAPPDHDTADGELLEEDEEDERTSMLRQEYNRAHSFQRSRTESDDEDWDSDRDRRKGGSGKGKGAVRDTDGRDMPPSERAPLPRCS
ncbi:deubiquitinase DESI2, partial [Lecanoromycetidae sp. Uapishka_2]